MPTAESDSALSPEREKELARLVQQGLAAREELGRGGHCPRRQQELEEMIRQGKEARDQLILSCSRLVRAIARNYAGCGLPMEDLVQEGFVGLIQAVDRYNPEGKCRLATFAYQGIRWAILRALIAQTHEIRLPPGIVSRIGLYNRAVGDLAQDLGESPDDEEVAAAMGISREELEEIRRAIRLTRMSSLDAPTLATGRELSCFIGEDGDVLEQTDGTALRELVHRLVSQLPLVEAVVIRLRYGLNGPPMTAEETGKALGLSARKVIQTERRALRRMRSPNTAWEARGLLA